MRTCVTFSFKSGCQEVPLSPLYERGQLHGVVFLTAARKFWKFCQEERLGGNDKAFLYSSWEVPQWWVEIFKTYCFDATPPDHCKFRWMECPLILPWQRSEDGWGVLGFGWWRMIASRNAWWHQVQHLTSTVDVQRCQHKQRARALESLPKHIRKNTWSQTR